jgi:hypothetical protein
VISRGAVGGDSGIGREMVSFDDKVDRIQRLCLLTRPMARSKDVVTKLEVQKQRFVVHAHVGRTRRTDLKQNKKYEREVHEQGKQVPG